MKILLSAPRGFCAGVNMAIEALQRTIDRFPGPVYVYHEIVHNRYVVERFERQGVVFVDRVEEVPRGAHLVYSAHGVSPLVERDANARELKVIDATCPLVRKVHQEAARFAQQGYTILLIGHRGHDEVVGTLGVAPERIVLVESVEDVDRIEVPDPTRVAYLTQTTLSIDEVEVIVRRIRRRFPDCACPPTDDICYATQNRQEALKALLGEATMVLVVGSRNSSNSNRLLEIARELGRPAYLVDSAAELQPQWFSSDDVVLLTAGASAPEILVQECVGWLAGRFPASVEERAVRRESVTFPLPPEVR
jgi:4-hydroxy-3-methylbut-2-en-1-yl diphosphate reductase